MNTIFQIAKNELKRLFSSPIAWLILAVFSFQAGLFFTQLFNSQVVVKEVGDSLLPLTDRIYTAFFKKMQDYLYLYIPLLTMGLLSIERSTGSIKLLYSSPVTNTQIALGKYLSMVIYNLVIVAILLVTVVFGAVHIPNLDYGHIFSAILGLYLLACAYSAVGLFMSSLTSYQIVAGLATLTLLSLLTMAGKMWQTIPVLRDVAYWISITGRANNMIAGLIGSEDVLYFILISAFFIMLTICKLNGEREKKGFSKKALEYVGIILLVVACGYVSILPRLKFYADATATKNNTVAVPTIEALKAVKGDITVTTFVNLLDRNFEYGMPEQQVLDKKRFERFVRFNKGMKFKYVYYYGPNANPDLEELYPGTTDKEKMQKVCENLGLKEKKFKTAEEVESKYGVDLSKEGYTFVRLLSTKDGNRTWLRMFHDSYKFPQEKEIAAAVKRLSLSPCKIGYLTGHGERSIEKLGDREFFVNVNDITYRGSWVNNGFDPVVVDLSQGIPSDIEILVIADPKKEFSEEDLALVKEYLEKGGNALICTESGHQQYINPVAEAIGVQYLPGCLLQESENFEPELVTAAVDSSAFDLFLRARWMRRWNYRIPMGRAAEYEFAADKGFEIINTFMSDPSGVRNDATGIEKSYPLLSQMKRTVGDKEQHIIVCAETDWLTNAELSRRRTGINQENTIVYNYAFTFLSDGNYPCSTDHPSEKDRYLNATHRTSVIANVLFMVVIPLLMIILCTIIRRIRKRQ
ncbi:MAG: Gldg family protein [Bacteroidales bacterium]|nr:Gldg family protein [Bacteroidales bacterium]